MSSMMYSRQMLTQMGLLPDVTGSTVTIHLKDVDYTCAKSILEIFDFLIG